MLPGGAILNRKTISLSRDGQYSKPLGLEVRVDNENVALAIPEGKMEVKPLVKPPWTLNDSEQRETDSQECPLNLRLSIYGKKTRRSTFGLLYDSPQRAL